VNHGRVLVRTCVPYRTTICCLFPSVITVGNDRSILLAATVMTQGAVLLTTCCAGPRFPEAYTTVIPFCTACRAPNEFSSATRDSDRTSTPSWMASSMAASTVAVVPARTPAALGHTDFYTAMRARGAAPAARPWKLAASTTEPEAVEAVCVPCPSLSRGVRKSILRSSSSTPAL
jgi:hypothetical protein